MAARVVLSEDAKLNMTPMIDMTFLLVVFFMLTIDLSSKEYIPVELPYASQGVEDKEEEGEVKRMVINLTGEGKVLFKGNEFDLAAEDPAQADKAIQSLQQELLNLVRLGGRDLREPDGASKIPVLVHADLNAQWKYVQWVMQACAHQNIKIYKIQFAVRKRPDDPASPPAAN
jgi:biopolymer transport protein ExbD